MVDAWPGRRNYELNSGTVLRDLYRLLTLILAEGELGGFAAANPRDDLVRLRDQFSEDELVHLLIGTAVTNRLQGEHMQGPRGERAEVGIVAAEGICGVLRPNVGADADQELTLREACNKIIHAETITADDGRGAQGEMLALPRILTLRGRHQGRAWEAHLNVVDYVRASVRNFDMFG